jgi:polyhydroxybutyrate depolymerase
MLALAGLCAAQPAGAEGPLPRFPAPGDFDLSLQVGSRQRTYRVHLPPGFAESKALPVLLAFHGGGGSAQGFQKYAGLDAVADREGFVVVYPDGSGRLGRRLLTWNAGGCCGPAREDRVDDVGFALRLLADLSRDLPLDRTRVYATGHSNGAMMTYRLAAEAADRIAAIAAAAGAMQVAVFQPSRPMPVLHIHSVDDPRALYAGGLGPAFPFTRRRVEHNPVEAELARWIKLDGCAPEPQPVEERLATGDGVKGTQAAVLLDYAPCTSGADVQLWKLTGAGHGWPGAPPVLGEKVMGPQARVISAAEEVWRFLKGFTRPDAPPLR